VTSRYAVFGNPVSHSKSPQIHTAFAEQTAQDLIYTKIEAPADGFKASVDAFRAQGGRGINVTTPFKLEALALSTDPLPRAAAAGASNCLKFDGDIIFAENFDGIGLVNDIQSNLGFPLKGRRVLLMGAGGAARGALLPILAQSPASLVIVNRTVPKAVALRDQFSSGGNILAIGYPDLAGQSFDIVINATSTGLRGEALPIPDGIFTGKGLAYELVYGKGLTPFLVTAKRAGVAKLADGVGMLIEQAAEAFEWWRGVRPNTRPLIETFTVPLR
jgi:shikimate dehydrogenase